MNDLGYNTKIDFMKIIKLILISFLFLTATTVFAHQPRLIYNSVAPNNIITINQPEISQAFYGELKGQSEVFSFHLDTPLKFYWNLLTPNLLGAREDFIIQLEGESKTGELIADSLNSQGKFWTKYYEPYSGDNYLKGPEATTNLPAGNYTIVVTNNGNLGKYVLVVGQIETPSLKNIWQTIKILPSLKRDFFEQSVWRAYNNRVGQYLAVAILILIFSLGFLLRLLGRKLWWLILMLLIISGLGFLVRWFLGPTDYWQCQDGQWLRRGNSTSPAPGTECLTPLGLERLSSEKLPTVDQIDNQFKSNPVAPAVSALVQQYLFNNLNTLIPAEDLARAKDFQLTDVVFIDNSLAIVGYQSGTDVWRAEFRFTIDEPEIIRGLSFKVIGKN
ncbi:MAG: hypothetical protein COX02_00525 [Candidatus Vogelbacteria bacterium CG22_combo_CG10-13_8_21_14_all_37_9]|uniref:Uncharacterized protein n=1 Tax=Candidatus Vogelbacteria bacterium CG22_combo_CG10-13_8_21_14_all_37_9 TaxID=1975046 RepID=A0A2H0BL38_9BACT|nr:MAG: hypothetical protein COX02_00525 [Candidatus Vogelbacteria bacterium CG22_combo_CG10-13_8_21_14_all_37_9]